jgi:hypothetical protein
MTSGTRYFLAASMAIAWTSITHAQKPTQDILQKLAQIKQPRPAFQIQLWVNQKTYQPGDPIEFSFRTDRDCYLTLIDVATEGVIRVIFPNQHSPNNFVRAGRTYNIPGDYSFNMKITGPAGTERIKAIATTRPMDIFNMDFVGGDYFFFETAAGSEVATRGIGGLKNQLKQHTWSETELEFEIRETTSAEKTRSLEENIGKPAPKPIPSTGTQEHKTRGLQETEGWPAPKPVPGTGTQEHKRP